MDFEALSELCWEWRIRTDETWPRGSANRRFLAKGRGRYLSALRDEWPQTLGNFFFFRLHYRAPEGTEPYVARLTSILTNFATLGDYQVL